MEFTAKTIAEFLNGSIEGNPEQKVSTVSGIEEGKPGSLSFLSNPKYTKYIYTTQSSIVIINKDFILDKPVITTLIRVPNAYESFAKLLELVSAYKQQKVGVHPQAIIEQSASIGEDVYIGAMAYIGENVTLGNNVKIYPHAYIGDNVVIGDESIIYAGVKVYDECRIGNNCIIHAGAVVGSDGFGFAPQDDGSYKKIPQLGNVLIEDDVEVGSNTTIDRATMGSTIIRKGVKLDNLIQIAHNVEVGKNTVIAAQTGIAGSTKVGERCMFGGQVGVSGHISIAEGVKLSAQTGVPNSIKVPNETLIGSPAMNSRKYSRSFVLFKRLPEIKSDIDSIKRKIESADNK
ncbi:MAG: UDP-3-O-(3-hydroxymyristoyl)glucosamine N-acyltransferase [Perlabentimonas sp.]